MMQNQMPGMIPDYIYQDLWELSPMLCFSALDAITDSLVSTNIDDPQSPFPHYREFAYFNINWPGKGPISDHSWFSIQHVSNLCVIGGVARLPRLMCGELQNWISPPSETAERLYTSFNYYGWYRLEPREPLKSELWHRGCSTYQGTLLKLKWK